MLAHDSEQGVRREVAKNTSTPPETLDMLATTDYPTPYCPYTNPESCENYDHEIGVNVAKNISAQSQTLQ